ncbi:fas-binding factor 1 isoform X3 [Cinclus cinclus]|uniref:fas-binding factor 1 isoform X3 n=1 Tax=Cinclus cinclus TaxID=127875 RepID=UPI002E0F027F
MAAKARSRLPDPIEDVLGDLLGFDEEPPAPPSQGSCAPFLQVSPRGGLDGDSRGKFLTESVEGLKELDQPDKLDHVDELDELDAEILGIARVRSRPGKHAGKGLGKDPKDPLEKPFLGELVGPRSSSGNKAGQSKDSALALPRPDATFGDDVDDLVHSLGLGNSADGAGNAPGAPGGQGIPRDHARLQGQTPEQPGKAEFQPESKEQRLDGCQDLPDFPFGSYEPSVASGTARRRGRRFPVGSSSRCPSGAAWLGLKDEDFLGLGSKDEDFPQLGSKHEDSQGLGQKDSQGVGQKDSQGLGSKNEDFQGFGLKDKDSLELGQKDEHHLGSGVLARRRSWAEAPEQNSHPWRVPESPEPSRLEFPGRTQPRPQAAAALEVPAMAPPTKQDPEAPPAQPCLENSRALPSWLCPEPPRAFPAQKHQQDPGFLPSQQDLGILPSHQSQKYPGVLQSHPSQQDLGILPSYQSQKDPGILPSHPPQQDLGILPSHPSQKDPGILQSHPPQQALGILPPQQDLGILPSQPHPDSQTLQSHPGSGISLCSLQARLEELENQVRSLEREREQQGRLLGDLLESSHRSQDPPTSQDHPGSQNHPRSQEQDEQLTVLQDRLCRQQRDAEREQSRLQEAVANLESRLGEREQLLEQERRRAAAERSRADSLREALEEQRRLSAQLLAMERAALDEAKAAWLEEQQAELRDRSEERRRLAAAWAEFHTRERLSRERAEQDKERALGMDSALRSLAKEQAELKFRSRELRSKEEELERDREELDEAWRKLRLEKEKVQRAEQRLREREEQIHALAQQDSQQALQDARILQAEQRLRLLQDQQDQLGQEEQRLHQASPSLLPHPSPSSCSLFPPPVPPFPQERLSLARHREQLQQLRAELSPAAGTRPGPVPSHGPAEVPPFPGWVLGDAGAPELLWGTPMSPSAAASVVPGLLPPLGMVLGGNRDTLGSAALYGHLLVLKQRARMDHDFLENERHFLESLKKGP